MTVNIDLDAAQDLLEREWERIQSSDKSRYIDDNLVVQKIREVFHANQLTYKYILFTNILAKATNPAIHYRAMQAKSGLDGAYNARSLGHQVIVDWEKSHGERLGGSNEPFLNKPARDPEFALENAARSQSAQERLYNLLERLERKTNAGELDPVNVLREALLAFSELEPQTLDFESVSEVPYDQLHQKLESYLETTGGGERLAAVTAGTMTAHYNMAAPGEFTVKAEHANVPDEFSDDAGDVEIYRSDELVQAFEVKDKPTERSDIQHCHTKAQENELEEYHYLVGDGFKAGERVPALQEAQDGPVELILVYPSDLFSVLKFVGDEGRSTFLDAVGEFLNDMRAKEQNKRDFDNMVAEIRNP
ncbi:restriction endonuclease, SacI family [Haloarcula sp. Atlit-47R]|uniref:restriction endonuclease, SacI family n=1 Tax=Haloarcula sp. Atlit-47R TaxID=2282132 RepID=UPI0013150132|nr:restriction endonuclease, SacI family [Haloarcula sp. Atlit-47R]